MTTTKNKRKKKSKKSALKRGIYVTPKPKLSEAMTPVNQQASETRNKYKNDVAENLIDTGDPKKDLDYLEARVKGTAWTQENDDAVDIDDI